MSFVRKQGLWFPGMSLRGDTLRKGLIQYTPFDEGSGNTVRDVTGRKHTGTIVGATWAAAPFGPSLSLAGSTQYVTIPDAGEYSLTTGLSVVALVSFTDLSITNGICARYDAGQREFQFARLSTGGVYGWVANFDGSQYCGRYTADTSSIMPANTWHLLTYTWNGGTTGASTKIYIDGVQKDTTDFVSGFSSMTAGSSTTKLGYYDSTSTYAKIKYGFVAIYNRPISQGEINRFVDDWFVLSRPTGGWEFWGATNGAGGGGAATSYTFTGPTSGTVNVASTNFTIQPNGTFTGTITPATDGAGSFTPSSLTWAAASDAKTCTYTPTSTSGSPHTLSTSDNGGLTDPATIDYTVNSPPSVTAGTLSVSSVASGTVNLSTTTASSGTAPYNYQFHRGTTPDFTPGVGTAIGSNSTSTTYSDTGRTNGNVYYYKCVVTDAAAQTATSNMIPGVPASSQGWMFLGDSFGDYVWNGSATELNDFAMGRQLQAALDACYSDNSVQNTVSVEATSGADSSDFVATLLTAAMTAAPSATYPYVVCMLGLNDSYNARTKATYKSNVQSIVNTLQSNSYTKIFLCHPPLLWWGTIDTEAEQARLLEYCAAINEIVAGETDCYAITPLYGYTPNHTAAYGKAQNDIHPVEQGGAHTAMLLAKAIHAALNPATGGGIWMPRARQVGI